MPDRSTPDLGAVRRQFPGLPYVKPAGAAARATSLIDTSPDGIWTADLKHQARACFEVEVAGIELAVIMPEVYAHEELKMDSRFQVKIGGSVVGCKQICPCCLTNEFVLMGEINVHSHTKVRFANGNGKAIMPISRIYHCFNPKCTDVQMKKDRTKEQMETLGKYTADGITAVTAIQRKKVTELTELGVAFNGHDTRVILTQPRKVRAMLKGLVFWGAQGGCDEEYAEKILKAHMNLSEMEADMHTTSRAREKALMQAYHSFARAPPTRLVSMPPQEEEKKKCFSTRCMCKLLPRSEYSKKHRGLHLGDRPPPWRSASTLAIVATARLTMLVPEWCAPSTRICSGGADATTALWSSSAAAAHVAEGMLAAVYARKTAGKQWGSARPPARAHGDGRPRGRVRVSDLELT